MFTHDKSKKAKIHKWLYFISEKMGSLGILRPCSCILPLETLSTSSSSSTYSMGRLVRDINSNCGPNDTAPPNRSTYT